MDDDTGDAVLTRRHRARRLLLQVPAEIFVGSGERPSRGALVDLSMTSAFAILYEPQAFDGDVRVHLTCDGKWCRARGYVARRIPLARALGIRIAFSGCDRSFSAILRDWSRDPFSSPGRLARIRAVRILLC